MLSSPIIYMMVLVACSTKTCLQSCTVYSMHWPRICKYCPWQYATLSTKTV